MSAAVVREAVDTGSRASGAGSRPGSRRRLPWRTALAAAGGLVLLLAFPGYSLVPLAVLGPAALAVAVHGQRARSGAWLGMVFGLACFVPLLSWSGIYVGSFPWLALAVSQALFVALLGAATAAVSALRLWPLWTAALWVADEALRGRVPFGGFPWGRLGLSQAEGPFTALAAYGGVPLVSFAVALTGALLAAAALALARARRTVGAGPGSGGQRARGTALRTSAGAVAAPPIPARHRRRAGPGPGRAPRRPAGPRSGRRRRTPAAPRRRRPAR